MKDFVKYLGYEVEKTGKVIVFLINIMDPISCSIFCILVKLESKFSIFSFKISISAAILFRPPFSPLCPFRALVVIFPLEAMPTADVVTIAASTVAVAVVVAIAAVVAVAVVVAFAAVVAVADAVEIAAFVMVAAEVDPIRRV